MWPLAAAPWRNALQRILPGLPATRSLARMTFGVRRMAAARRLSSSSSTSSARSTSIATALGAAGAIRSRPVGQRLAQVGDASGDAEGFLVDREKDGLRLPVGRAVEAVDPVVGVLVELRAEAAGHQRHGKRRGQQAANSIFCRRDRRIRYL